MDPVSLNPGPDPDPAFHVNPDQDPIRIHGIDDQKMEKKIHMKKKFYNKNCNFFPLCLWVIFKLN